MVCVCVCERERERETDWQGKSVLAACNDDNIYIYIYIYIYIIVGVWEVSVLGNKLCSCVYAVRNFKNFFRACFTHWTVDSSISFWLDKLLKNFLFLWPLFLAPFPVFAFDVVSCTPHQEGPVTCQAVTAAEARVRLGGVAKEATM